MSTYYGKRRRTHSSLKLKPKPQKLTFIWHTCLLFRSSTQKEVRADGIKCPFHFRPGLRKHGKPRLLHCASRAIIILFVLLWLPTRSWGKTIKLYYNSEKVVKSICTDVGIDGYYIHNIIVVAHTLSRTHFLVLTKWLLFFGNTHLCRWNQMWGSEKVVSTGVRKTIRPPIPITWGRGQVKPWPHTDDPRVK